jgi:hypothetical protein
MPTAWTTFTRLLQKVRLDPYRLHLARRILYLGNTEGENQMILRILAIALVGLIWAAHQTVSAHIGSVPIYNGSLLVLVAILIGLALLTMILVLIRVFLSEFPRRATA